MKKETFIPPNTFFGNLKLIEDKGLFKQSNGINMRMGEVICFCGNIFTTRISGLKNGRVKSCGCGRRENHFTKHDMTNSPEYASWECMKGRCLNPHNKFYHNYGERGIKVCKSWLDFENFYKDMGSKPSLKHSIDRIDNGGNYEPSNCRWSDRFIQDRNKRNNIYVEYNGEKFVLCDLAKQVGMHQQTLKARLLRGLPVEEAIIKSFKYVKSNKYTKKNVILL